MDAPYLNFTNVAIIYSCHAVEVPKCSEEDEEAHEEKCKALVDVQGVFADCIGKLSAQVEYTHILIANLAG